MDHEYSSPRTANQGPSNGPGPLRLTSTARPGPLKNGTTLAQDHYNSPRISQEFAHYHPGPLKIMITIRPGLLKITTTIRPGTLPFSQDR